MKGAFSAAALAHQEEKNNFMTAKSNKIKRTNTTGAV